jgi:hypothetical protein
MTNQPKARPDYTCFASAKLHSPLQSGRAHLPLVLAMIGRRQIGAIIPFIAVLPSHSPGGYSSAFA